MPGVNSGLHVVSFSPAQQTSPVLFVCTDRMQFHNLYIETLMTSVFCHIIFSFALFSL